MLYSVHEFPVVYSTLATNEVDVRKLPTYIIASYTYNFISKLLQGGKNMVVFCLTVQKFHTLFCVGSLDCESRFQNGICVRPFQKKSKQEKGQKW